MPEKDIIEGEVVGSELAAPSVTSLGDVMSTAQLKASTKKAQEQRAIITTYVKDHLVKGVDYGQIGSFKKDVLFKPGQEKIFSLMNLTSRLEKDAETLDMLGNEKGTIAYICRVYRKGEEIAQGRGAAKVGENSRDINSTIKIAEKRARMDACLSLGFSEFFTQDLEDPEYQGKANDAQNGDRLATIKQKNLISKLFLERGANTPNLLLASIEANGVKNAREMTAKEASDLIEKLFANSAEVVKGQPEEHPDLSRGDGDPDVHGYPGEADEVTDADLSEEQIAENLAEAEANLLRDRGVTNG